MEVISLTTIALFYLSVGFFLIVAKLNNPNDDKPSDSNEECTDFEVKIDVVSKMPSLFLRIKEAEDVVIIYALMLIATILSMMIITNYA